MTKNEEIMLVVRCATNHAIHKKSCSGCDEQFLCRKIQTFLRERFPEYEFTKSGELLKLKGMSNV